MNFSISLTVNGVRRDVELDDPRVTLLDLLRERAVAAKDQGGDRIGGRPARFLFVDGLVLFTLALSPFTDAAVKGRRL